jgi:hypothetical protein
MEDENRPEQSNTVAIARFFGINGKDAMEQLRQLTAEEKQAFGDGIRNGTLTY